MTLNIKEHFPDWQPGQLNALGFDKAPADTRVVVAMSGGVDSCVTAALLKDLGFDVIGMTMQLYDHGEAVQRKGACCAGQDIHDARRVAATLDFPHYVLNYESLFQDSVMQDFADSYIRGETPIPCVRCNQTVKFRDMLTAAKDLDADCLATGHYIKSVPDNGNWQLHCAVDEGKDQSYFLFATTKEQLSFLRFPLGGLQKEEVRELAGHYDLAVADKPDSQDICFVPQGKYVSVIERLRPGASEPGDIVHVDDERVLGEHPGIIHFTIGQRRGIGIGGTEEPLYVVALRPDAKQVVVGPHEALMTGSMRVDEINWLGSPDASGEGIPIRVRFRNTQAPVPAKVMLHRGESGGGEASVVFDEPQAGVSPGQAAVFYDGPQVLGGGWIRSAASSYRP